MRLYHFTARHRLEPVLRHGLTLGLTTVIDGGKTARIQGYQWLTKNPSFRQTWNDASLLPFEGASEATTLATYDPSGKVLASQK